MHAAKTAARARVFFDTELPLLAHEVRLTGDGSLQWIERTGKGDKIHDTEPGTSAWRRPVVNFLSALPIEWLL